MKAERITPVVDGCRNLKIVKRQFQMQRNCQDCIYYEAHMCAYIDVMGHRRPCPPGDACTAKIKKGAKRSKVGIKIRKDDEDNEKESTGTGSVHGYMPGSEGL